MHKNILSFNFNYYIKLCIKILNFKIFENNIKSNIMFDQVYLQILLSQIEFITEYFQATNY